MTSLKTESGSLTPRVSEQSELLLALAARCEREEPSHELDKAILRALGYTWRGMAYWYRDDSHTWKGGSFFTSNLDHVMQLVPEGAGIELTRYWLRKPGEWWNVRLTWGLGTKVEQAYVEDVRSAALALCAAALRTRAALSKQEG